MVLELEKPRVTELHVRMDCNGCVHKIKKAMHGVDGVYDISIDFAQQKLTVVGRAELDKILRAIKKTRKIATICSHTDPNAPPPPPEPAPAPAPAPPAEPPAPEPPAEEAPKEPTPPAAPQENQAAAEAKPPAEEAKDATAAPAEPKVIEEVHMVHHYPYNNYITCNRQYEESPMYVYPWPMPAPKNRYSWVEACSEPEYYYQSQRAGYGNRNITSIFSEENPNNCAIM